MSDLVVDNFAGGGGASTGIEAAIGRPVDVAINHDAQAIAMHQANHPHTFHVQNDIWSVDPVAVTKGQHVRLAWFSPDCTHFSKAAGRRPRQQNIRDLAWVVIRWAGEVRPDVIMLENVEEFQTWGPLDEDGYPDRARAGETFAEWYRQLEILGYEVERRELRAADYGAPTIRKRLFIIARRDGMPIVWPDVTHAKAPTPDLLPWRAAAECIDWSVPVPSIFDRQRPLVEATQRRIAAGIKRYVLDDPDPFLVPGFLVGVGGRAGQSRPRSAGEPMATTTAKADTALVTPYLHNLTHGGRAEDIESPFMTITGAHRGEKALIAPSIVPMTHGNPPVSVRAPLGTTTTQHNKHLLTTAFLVKHFGGMVGVRADTPLPTTTTRNTQIQIATSHLMHLRGTGVPHRFSDPLLTVAAGGTHYAEVRALLVKFYGNDHHGQGMQTPFGTMTTKDRFGLVTVWIQGEPWVMTDIGMRMLTPRELYRAQGFPEGYIIDPLFGGKPLPKTHQVRMCGNSVCPPVAEAMVGANVGRLGQQSLWRGYEIGDVAVAG